MPSDDAARQGVLGQLSASHGRTATDMPAALDEGQVAGMLTRMQALRVAEALPGEEGGSARYGLRHSGTPTAPAAGCREPPPVPRRSSRATAAASHPAPPAMPQQHLQQQAFIPGYVGYSVAYPFPSGGSFQPVVLYSYPAAGMSPLAHVAPAALRQQPQHAAHLVPAAYSAGLYMSPTYTMRPTTHAIGAPGRGHGWGGAPLAPVLPSSLSSPPRAVRPPPAQPALQVPESTGGSWPAGSSYAADEGPAAGVESATVPSPGWVADSTAAQAARGGAMPPSSSSEQLNAQTASVSQSSAGDSTASSTVGEGGRAPARGSRGQGERQACAFFLKTGTCAWGDR